MDRVRHVIHLLVDGNIKLKVVETPILLLDRHCFGFSYKRINRVCKYTEI